jgi:hypothetical protein
VILGDFEGEAFPPPPLPPLETSLLTVLVIAALFDRYSCSFCSTSLFFVGFIYLFIYFLEWLGFRLIGTRQKINLLQKGDFYLLLLR